jgi:predicted ATPase/DNA-binding SARP family transcriptional activator
VTSILHIQLLGGFALRADTGQAIPIDHPRLQALLAYLVLHRSTPQSRQHLAFLLWPDSAEAQARTNLRTLLHRLRQALPEADRFLSQEAQAVQWRADASWTLDVADFEQALGQADRAGQVGDHVAERAALARAVERYGGELLPGRYDDWVLLERERLSQAFLAALERLVLLLEQARIYAAAIASAQQLLHHDPLREATYQHLMRLHMLNGDRASAMRVYQTCVAVLERELGVEPSAGTRAAHDRLLQAAPPAQAPEPLAQPAEATAATHNLPLVLTSFVGRERQRAEIARAMGTTRLLTLTGAGGCGKTRMALAVAADVASAYPEGVWFVDLATLGDGDLLSQEVAAVLGVREETRRPLLATLADALRAQEILLILDNCEHLIEPCARFAQALLGACPRLHILATRREPLGVAGETTWLVPSLALPDPHNLPPPGELAQVESVRLFVERAASALPTFALAPANAAAVAQICRRLDGIPLAIELAAARVKVLSPEQIAARLDDCFGLLSTGSRTALPRHQSLRATIAWSYVLRSVPVRALFRRLGVFAGGWALEAAETVGRTEGRGLWTEAVDTVTSVLGPHSSVLDLLAALVDKSLVVVETQGDHARYRLLESMRQYARAKLRDAGEEAAVEHAFAAYYLDIAEQGDIGLRGAQEDAWLARLDAEHDNMRAVLSWSVAERATWRTSEGATRRYGDEDLARSPLRLLAASPEEIGLRLVAALAEFWSARGYLSEGRRWAEDILTADGDTLAETRARALVSAGMLLWARGDYAEARRRAEEGREIARERGHIRGEASALIVLGRIARYQGDFSAARALFERSLALYRQANERWGIAQALHYLGDVLFMQGDFVLARGLTEEALAVARALQARSTIGIMLHTIGLIALGQGDYSAAERVFAESLKLFRQLGNKFGLNFALNDLGEAARLRGDYARAGEHYAEALALSRALGFRWGVGWLTHNLGYVAIRGGDTARGVALFAESLGQFRDLASQDGIASCLAGIAVAAPPEMAVRLLGAAEALLESMGAVLEPADRAEYARTAADVRARLDAATLASAWQAGRALLLEQAIAEALRIAHSYGRLLEVLTLHESGAHRGDHRSYY